MWGFNHLPKHINVIQVDEFVGQQYSNGLHPASSQLYTIPKGATFLYIVLIAGGGTGGTPVVGAATSGGGGGGSGAIVKALCPVCLLPPFLYVTIPGDRDAFSTHVAITPNAPVQGCIVRLNALGGIGGADGTAGSGAAAMLNSVARFSGTLALWTSQAGASGGAGSTTNGAAVTALGTLPLTGGGGGGGSSGGTGGDVTGAGIFPTIAGAATGHNPGLPGFGLKQPFGGVGGSGGGGVNGAGTGLSKGGDGAIGCGGGGGGNAASGTPGGGGLGGPGYCMIVAF